MKKEKSCIEPEHGWSVNVFLWKIDRNSCDPLRWLHYPVMTYLLRCLGHLCQEFLWNFHWQMKKSVYRPDVSLVRRLPLVVAVKNRTCDGGLVSGDKTPFGLGWIKTAQYNLLVAINITNICFCRILFAQTIDLLDFNAVNKWSIKSLFGKACKKKPINAEFWDLIRPHSPAIPDWTLNKAIIPLPGAIFSPSIVA